VLAEPLMRESGVRRFSSVLHAVDSLLETYLDPGPSHSTQESQTAKITRSRLAETHSSHSITSHARRISRDTGRTVDAARSIIAYPLRVSRLIPSRSFRVFQGLPGSLSSVLVRCRHAEADASCETPVL
jgi:hypothetical protein